MFTKSLRKKKVYDIFNDYITQLEAGKNPSLFAIQQKHGYTESSARCYAVTRTKAWGEIMNKHLDDEVMASRHRNIIEKGKDGDALRAIELGHRLKGRMINRSANLTIKRKIDDLK